MAVSHVAEMKGRVTVFSISGCPHCKAAKTLLKKKGVHYVEINLDVYPERRSEVQARAKKTSMPQIFFNEELIGGNDSLQALEAASQLDAKIAWVNETPAPPSAPSPPNIKFSEDESPVALDKQDEHLETAVLLKKGVEISDVFQFPTLHKNCFRGSAAVKFLAKELKICNTEAVEIGRILLKKHFFRTVTGNDSFEDGPHLYRFLEDRMALMKHNCLNFSGKVVTFEAPPATEAAEKVRKIILAIYDEFLSEDGKGVDYKGIAKAESYRRYVKKTESLQRVDLSVLNRDEKISFFINIYNALVIHATVSAGNGPETALQRKKFFSDFTYLIGGNTYSLSEIENGILRGNRRPPYALQKPFGNSDERTKIALDTPEPLIHFALVCGAKSCPPVKTYKPVGLDDLLRAAAKSFFEGGGIEIDGQKGTISLSKILFWYHVDFGKDDVEMLKWVSHYLEDAEKDKLLGLLEKRQFKLTYQEYDWSANSKH